jgi:hypothetical protein
MANIPKAITTTKLFRAVAITPLLRGRKTCVPAAHRPSARGTRNKNQREPKFCLPSHLFSGLGEKWLHAYCALPDRRTASNEERVYARERRLPTHHPLSPRRRHGCTLREDRASETGFMANNPKLLPEKHAEHIRHERNATGKQKLERAANQSCQKAPAILANRAIA